MTKLNKTDILLIILTIIILVACTILALLLGTFKAMRDDRARETGRIVDKDVGLRYLTIPVRLSLEHDNTKTIPFDKILRKMTESTYKNRAAENIAEENETPEPNKMTGEAYYPFTSALKRVMHRVPRNLDANTSMVANSFANTRMKVDIEDMD